MRTYVRVQDGRVAERVTTDANIAALYHPALRWVEAPANLAATEGWAYDGKEFRKPEPTCAGHATLSVAALRAQIAALSAQLSELLKVE